MGATPFTPVTQSLTDGLCLRKTRIGTCTLQCTVRGLSLAWRAEQPSTGSQTGGFHALPNTNKHTVLFTGVVTYVPDKESPETHNRVLRCNACGNTMTSDLLA